MGRTAGTKVIHLQTPLVLDVFTYNGYVDTFGWEVNPNERDANNGIDIPMERGVFKSEAVEGLQRNFQRARPTENSTRDYGRGLG